MREIIFIPEGQRECSVKAWIHDSKGSNQIKQCDYPAVIICPGGGYEHVSSREAEPVALPFFEAGYNTYILDYSVNEQASEFQPLCQLADTIAQIRKNAKEWHTLSNQIVTCGFSAGAHLAGSLGTLSCTPEFAKFYGDTSNIFPNAMILCYPVITSDEFAHTGSIEKVSGSEKNSDKYRWFGLDKHVDECTPPTFLWHTAEDAVVPVENSLKMAAALSAAKVPFELHVFPQGPHGMSVCTEEVGTKSEYNARWVEWSIKWLKGLLKQ